MVRWLLLIGLILLVPIVPFVLFHGALERGLERLLSAPLSGWTAAALVIGLLGTDVLLPVPSSLVSTLAGGQLGTIGATLASWVGLNLGALVGYQIGRRWGRPVAEKFAGVDDLGRLERLGARYALPFLVLTRALPILSEAAVLLCGIQQLAPRRFWPPVLLSNLGIALAYSVLGEVAADQEWLAIACSVSVALPLLATVLVKRFWPAA